MKRHWIKALAVAGLATAAVSPAYAGHDDFELVLRVGPTWLYYDVDDRRYDRRYDGRYDDRDYRHWRKRQKHHYKQHRRQDYAHDRWHWYYDRRRDRYYRCDHADLHYSLRHRH
jgi:hypothetical protein